LTDTLKLPTALDLAVGDTVSLELSGVVANDGQILIKKMIRRSPDKSDRQQAVDHFIQKWTGAVTPSASLQDLDDLRWEAMKEKYSFYEDTANLLPNPPHASVS